MAVELKGWIGVESGLLEESAIWKGTVGADDGRQKA